MSKVLDAQPGRKDISMIGNRFGLLVVESFSHNNKQQNKVWNCKCDCGNTTQARTTELRQGRKTSCKCNQYKKGEGVYNFTGYKDITGTKWYSIKQNALNRNLEFNISKEFAWNLLIEQRGLCKLSGSPISFKEGTASIDRIDNSLGYINSNIQIVHKDINLMRNKFDMNYFLEMCRKIAKYN